MDWILAPIYQTPSGCEFDFPPSSRLGEFPSTLTHSPYDSISPVIASPLDYLGSIRGSDNLSTIPDLSTVHGSNSLHLKTNGSLST